MEKQEIDALPPMDLAFGELREQLVAAVLAGKKTATSSLHRSYLVEDEPLPEPGFYRLVDRNDDSVGVVEVTDVEVRRLGDVDDAVAHAEGEGYRSAADWRRSHEAFWVSAGEASEGDLDDDTLVVVERFRWRPDLGQAGGSA